MRQYITPIVEGEIGDGTRLVAAEGHDPLVCPKCMEVVPYLFSQPSGFYFYLCEACTKVPYNGLTVECRAGVDTLMNNYLDFKKEEYANLRSFFMEKGFFTGDFHLWVVMHTSIEGFTDVTVVAAPDYNLAVERATGFPVDELSYHQKRLEQAVELTDMYIEDSLRHLISFRNYKYSISQGVYKDLDEYLWRKYVWPMLRKDYVNSGRSPESICPLPK